MSVQRDFERRKAAVYLHNLTTILADSKARTACDSLDYSLGTVPETVHDLLLQRSDGAFELVVWDERLKGEDHVTVSLSAPQDNETPTSPSLPTTAISRRRIRRCR